MTRIYSDPSRAEDKWALPDVEVFYAEAGEFELDPLAVEPVSNEAGWYYWFCIPGCLPDSVPYGPFLSEADAIKSCRTLHALNPDPDIR